MSFFLLKMQTPVGEPPWYRRSVPPLPDEPATVPMENVKRASADYPKVENVFIFPEVSLGGRACWEIGMRYPDPN
jgi:hypothetical protein